MSEKKAVDWERIEAAYRAGLLSLREIGRANSVSHVAIAKHAQRHGWERQERVKPSPAAVPLPIDEFEKSGFVYVVYIDDSRGARYFKIGMAKVFSSRMGSHQCSSPFQVYVACAYFVPNMRKEERELHELYKGQRVRGEWFELSPDDLRDIGMRSVLL